MNTETMMTNEAGIPHSGKLTVTTPSATAVAVERTFEAPARLVWDAHTKPELIRQWLTGPEGWSMPVCEVDLRVGGRYRFEWGHPSEQGFGTGGEFTVVEPHTRLRSTERMDGFEGEAANLYEFSEQDGRTTLLLTMEFGSQEARDGAVATGMTDGMGASFDRLEALLPSITPSITPSIDA